MLPRHLPTWLLSLIWLVGLSPYLLIEFWLIELPPLFSGADKVGRLVGNFSLAFASAFPFWWVIEWFQRRARGVRVAQIQRRFIDSFFQDFNAVVYGIIRDESGRNYALEANEQELLRILHQKRYKNISDAEDLLYGSVWFFLQRWPRDYAILEPYLGEMSLEFNHNVTMASKKRDDILTHAAKVPALTTPFLLEMLEYYLRLEYIYRIEHGLSTKGMRIIP